MGTRNSSVSWSRHKWAPQDKDNHEIFCKRILTNQIDNKLMFAFFKRRSIRRVIYRIGSFYKKITGHSFSYHLGMFWIQCIFRERVWEVCYFNTLDNSLIFQKREGSIREIFCYDSGQTIIVEPWKTFSCVNQELVRKELVKEAVINLPPVNADATLLAENKLRLDGASDFTKQTRQLHIYQNTKFAGYRCLTSHFIHSHE